MFKIGSHGGGGESDSACIRKWNRSSPALFAMAALVLVALVFLSGMAALGTEQGPDPAPLETGSSNAFPEVSEVLQGRVFTNKFERDVFFLRAVRERYPAYWPSVLRANIVVNDYVVAPGALLRFVEELGTAMTGTDDLVTITNLAAVTSNPIFYANADAYRPDIVRAAALALIRVGPRGRQELANSLSETHYRTDVSSLEVIAGAIGESGASDSRLIAALTAAAFSLTATNGGSYPRCTKETVKSLLRFPDGVLAVGANLNAKQVFDDPGRFQAVVDGIAEARVTRLTTNLVEVASAVTKKLDALNVAPGPYRDELLELQARLKKAMGELHEDNRQ